MFLNPLFGIKHIILLCVSLIFVIIFYILLMKKDVNKVIKLTWIICFSCEVVKVIYYIITNESEMNGYLPKSDLPFHLCSIQIIFLTILLFSKSERIKKILISFMIPSCLIGGLFALLIPTSSARNGMWIITFEYFLYHVVIWVYALVLFTSKEINLTINDYKSCMIFLLLIGLFSIYLNSILNDGSNNINFMYTVSPPQEGLPYLNKDKGWAIYMLRYGLLAFVLITLLYIKPIVIYLKSIISKNTHNSD